MIQIKNLNKKFINNKKTFYALKNVSLNINKGEIFGIIGLSGAGKSTLIRTLNRLEEPDSGEILFENKNILTLDKKELRLFRQNTGMIFQNFNLLNSRDVFSNIAYPLEIIGLSKSKIKKRVQELLTLVNLEDKIHAYPSQLSGGQKQRVSIARALANNPSVLLCDEATSALDPKTTASILKLLKELKSKLNLTIIIITHQMEVVRDICEKVAIIEAGEIIELESVSNIFTSPKSDTAKSFIRDLHQETELIYTPMKGSTVLELKFKGSQADQPIISKLSQLYNININILSGNINHLASNKIGTLLIQITATNEEINNCINTLTSWNIHSEVISND